MLPTESDYPEERCNCGTPLNRGAKRCRACRSRRQRRKFRRLPKGRRPATSHQER